MVMAGDTGRHRMMMAGDTVRRRGTEDTSPVNNLIDGTLPIVRDFLVVHTGRTSRRGNVEAAAAACGNLTMNEDCASSVVACLLQLCCWNCSVLNVVPKINIITLTA